MPLLDLSVVDIENDGEWSTVLDWPLIAIHAILTPDGKVLTYGTDARGRQSGQFIYDVWDPLTDTHYTLPNTTETDTFCSAAIIVPTTGEILISGGDSRGEGYPINNGVDDVNVYDYRDMSVSRSPTGDMEYARWYPTLVTLGNGEIFVIGGRDGPTPMHGGQFADGVGTPEVYTPGVGWRTLTGAYSAAIEEGSADGSTGGWWYPRAWLLSNGLVFAFDPFDRFGNDEHTMMLIDPGGTGSIQDLGALPFSSQTTMPAVMYGQDKFLVLAANAAGDLWSVDLSTGAPVATQVGALGERRHWADMTLLADGTVLISGGSGVANQEVDITYGATIWDPATGNLTDVASAAIPRLYHSTALLLPDASVLISGGGAPGPTNQLNGEIYYPTYLFDADGTPAERLAIVTAPEMIDAGDGFTVQVDDAASVSRLLLSAFQTATHSFNMGARQIELDFTVVDATTLNVTTPDNGNYLTPGYWLLFAIDGQGTPSLGETIIVGIDGAAVEPPPPVAEPFEPLEYIASYSDLMDAYGANAAAGATHFAIAGQLEGRTVTFNGLDYIASHGDLIAAYGPNAAAGAAHYIMAGRFEGRNVTFDGLEYVASHEDLIVAFGANGDAGASHFIVAGINEGRSVTFDALSYIASYGDLIVAFGANEDAGAAHLILAGRNEGRTVTFDAAQYLANYGDLQAAFGTDLDLATQHFILAGFAEGRTDDFIA